MRAEIKRIQRETGVTTILVTHDQVEATAMADRIVCMKDGHIEQVAAPHEVYETPDNLFVAGFIGSPPINFVKGKAEAGCFSVNGTSVAGHSHLNGDATLGLRPEFLHLGQGDLQARVLEFEPMGREILYLLETPLGKLTALESEVKPSYRHGDTVTVGWQAEDALYFDRKGRRVDPDPSVSSR